MTVPRRILLLGGTADARRLAERLAADARLHTITSLAGRTETPAPLPGHVRRGGFGGAVGLAQYVLDEAIDAVIDATHPFAARISANAAHACAETGTPRLHLARPAWPLPEGAAITRVADFAAAAAALPKDARAFLTTGTQEMASFAGRADVHFLVRLIAPPKAPLPLARHDLVLGRPPFQEEAERALMAAHGIDTIISKDSGGAATAAKLAAAARLGIRIILIDRPAPPAGDQAATIEDAIEWVEKNALGGPRRP